MRVNPSLALQTAIASIEQARANPRPAAERPSAVDAARAGQAGQDGRSASAPAMREAGRTVAPEAARTDTTRVEAARQDATRAEAARFAREIPRPNETPRDYRPGRYLDLTV